MPTTDPERARPPTAVAGLGPGKALGPYQILREIGRGGMGVVYQAFHPGLKRTVALKVLIAGEDASEEALARFHREAESVAKLGHHPNIVPIYDIGQVGATGDALSPSKGRSPLHYFAMHFVDGQSLDKIIDQGTIPPKRAAGIARKVAEALRHAHAHGILHRDVKPANILLAQPDSPDGAARHTDPPDRKDGERDTRRGAHPSEATPHAAPRSGESVSREAGSGESGKWVPMLTDFGLARDAQADSNVTRSGTALGTPNYMPPEQADGRRKDVDARSDVWSLGATLYEMLTGVPPFEGETVAHVLRRVLLADPRPPRRVNPAVDRDLETICLKCLEKEPGRRYATAGELADDLGRFLDGRPIVARPASVAERLLRRVRRHPAASAALGLLGLALLAAASVAAAAGRNWFAERRRSASIEIEKAEALTGRGKAEEGERDARALMEKGQRAARVLLGASTVLGKAHDGLEKAYHGSPNPEDRKKAFEKRREEIDRFFAGIAPDSASQAAALALRGWLTRLGGDREKALPLLRKAQESDPEVPWGFLFEALDAVGRYLEAKPVRNIRYDLAGITVDPPSAETPEAARERARFEGLFTGAVRARAWSGSDADFRAALEGLRALGTAETARAEAGLSKALGLTELFWVRIEVRLARGQLRYDAAQFAGALSDAGAVLDEFPGNVTALTLQGKALEGLALEARHRGEDARDLFRRSVAAFGEAIGLAPDFVTPVQGRGIASLFLASALEESGEDPRGLLQDAIRDLTRAHALRPDFYTPLANRGMARRDLGEAMEHGGEDPAETYRLAIADYDAALAIDPSSSLARGGRGTAWWSLGSFLASRGDDPSDPLRRAAEDYAEALRTEPANPGVHHNLGAVFQTLGEAKQVRGADPRDDYRSAIREFAEAARALPGLSLAHHSAGNAWWRLGDAETVLGGSGDEAYANAVREYGEAIRLDPRNAEAVGDLGNVYLSRGEALACRDEDPREQYRAAIEQYGRAIALNPGNPLFFANRAGAWASLGEVLAAFEEDPGEALAAAVADATASLGLRPGFLISLVNRGNARWMLAVRAAARKEDPAAFFRDAVADFEEAARRYPEDAESRNALGNVLAARAEFEASGGGDAGPTLEKARAAYLDAIAKNPSLWPVYEGLGKVLERLARWEEAAAAYEKAQALAGDNAPGIGKALERVRAKAAAAGGEKKEGD